MLFYLTGFALVLVAFIIFVMAPRNLWDTLLALVGFIILLIPFLWNLNWASPPLQSFLLFFEQMGSVIGPLLMFLFGSFMVAQAWTLFHKEQNLLQLSIGIALGLLLISICLLHYLAIFGFHVGEFQRWVKIPDFMMTYYVLLFVNYLVVTVRLTFMEDEGPKDYVLILGANLQPDGSLTNVLKRRLNQALSYLSRQQFLHKKEPKIIVSGASTQPYMKKSEASRMRDYLMAHGVEEERILLDEEAENTHGNFYYCRLLLEEENFWSEKTKIVFITSNYHLYRSQLYANMEGLYQMSGIGARASLREWLRNGVREYVAILFMHRKGHLFLSLLLLLAGLLRYLHFY